MRKFVTAVPAHSQKNWLAWYRFASLRMFATQNYGETGKDNMRRSLKELRDPYVETDFLNTDFFLMDLYTLLNVFLKLLENLF